MSNNSSSSSRSLIVSFKQCIPIPTAYGDIQHGSMVRKALGVEWEEGDCSTIKPLRYYTSFTFRHGTDPWFWIGLSVSLAGDCHEPDREQRRAS